MNNCVTQFIEAARASASEWWEECRAFSARRAAAGAPSYEELWEEYDFLRVLGGGEFDPETLCFAEDELIDVINQEFYARLSRAECIEHELDRMFGNSTREVLRATAQVGCLS